VSGQDAARAASTLDVLGVWSLRVWEFFESMRKRLGRLLDWIPPIL
jgi:hypothetical protein